MTKHLRAPLRRLFLSRTDYIAYAFLAFLNLVIFILSFRNLAIFAQTEKIFSFSEGTSINPALLLMDGYSGVEVSLFLFVVFFIECFVVWKIIRLGRKIGKRALFIYAALMQAFVLFSLLLIALTPQAVLLSLTHKANKEISSAIRVLNNPTERKKNYILSTPDEIAKQINTISFENFQILESSPEQSAIINFLRGEKKDTFYRAITIPYAVRTNRSMQDLQFSMLLFPNNKLVVNTFSKEDLQVLLPSLSRKILASEFGSYITGDLPQTSFLNQKEYVIQQTIQEEKIKKGHEEYIAYLNNYILDSDRIVGVNQKIIDEYPADKEKAQKSYEEYAAKWGSWYEDCKKRRGENPVCEEGKTSYETNIKKLGDSLVQIDENKKKAEENIKLSISYKNSSYAKLATAKKNYQDFLRNPITAEMQDGVFNSPNDVYVRYHDRDTQKLTRYLDILLHEYLHFYSYSTKGQLEPFLDEGLTEYLKNEVIKKYIEPELMTHSYNEEVAIADTLVKHLSREKIIPLYFNPNAEAFKKEFIYKFTPSKYESFLMKSKDLFYTPRDSDLREAQTEEIQAILML